MRFRIILVFAFVLFVSGIFTNAQNSNVAIGNKIYTEQQEPANSTVRGRVFYENTGRPVRRASIMLMSKDAGRSEFSGLTDNNGYFQIKNIKAGTYYAFINAPGVISPLAYADISKPRSDGFPDAIEDFQPIIVNGISNIDVEIPAKQGGAVNGRVMYSNGDTAIGVKVEILRKVENLFIPVIPNFSTVFSMFGGNSGFQTDDRGMYRFSGLPAGEYIVKVSENASHSDHNKRGYYDPLESLFGNFSLLTMYYPDVFETEKAEIINVVPGQEQYDINIIIPDRNLYRIEGKIISAKTKLPIAGAKITIKKVGDNTASIFNIERMQHGNSSDEQGFWDFSDLPKGTYKLSIEAAERIPGESGENYPSNMMITNAVNLAVYNQNYTERKYARRNYEITLEDKNLTEIVIELGYGATISGTVETEKSQKMPSLTTIYAGNESDDLFLSASVHNQINESEKQPKMNHVFEIKNVPAGKTFFKFLISEEDFYVKTATAGSKDLLTDSIELGEGEILRNVKVVFGNDVGTIKGKVFDGGNQPAKRTELTLIPTDAAKRKIPSFYRYVTTDEKGEFSVKVAPYEYAVIIVDKKIAAKQREEFVKWLEEIIKDAQKVTVSAGETSTIKFLLP